MATRKRFAYELPGRPRVLPPDPDLLEQGGATGLAKRLRKAIELRTDCSGPKPPSETPSRRTSRRSSKTGPSTPRRSHAPQRHLGGNPRRPGQDCRGGHTARYNALVLAVEQQADEIFSVAEQEADQVREAARQQRERSASELRAASEQVNAALDSFEALLGAARFASDPGVRSWRVALRSAEFRRTRLDEALRILAELGDWLERQPLSGEEPDEPRIVFGHGALQTFSRSLGQVGT
jgi:hypothetical protein